MNSMCKLSQYPVEHVLRTTVRARSRDHWATLESEIPMDACIHACIWHSARYGNTQQSCRSMAYTSACKCTTYGGRNTSLLLRTCAECGRRGAMDPLPLSCGHVHARALSPHQPIRAPSHCTHMNTRSYLLHPLSNSHAPNICITS